MEIHSVYHLETCVFIHNTMTLCPKCTDFFACNVFNNLCSYCYNGGPPKKNSIPSKNVNEWVKSKLLSRSFTLLLKRCAKKGEKALARVLRTLTKHNNWKNFEGKWITAEVAHDLLTITQGSITPRDGMLTIHCIVLSRVIDYWNIAKVFGEKSTYNCYFGQPSCTWPTKLPPTRGILTEGHLGCLKF